jgi:guanylate kinase
MIYQNDERGTLLIITGPFACGKTALAEALSDTLEKQTTVTTRPRRPHEKYGIDYNFMDVETFLHERDVKKSFIETVEINGHFYATPRSIETNVLEGKHTSVCIDPRGAKFFMTHPHEFIRDAVITVYLEVSLQESVCRYLCRDQEFDSKDLAKRIATREIEEGMKHIFQHRVPNPTGNFNETIMTVRNIVTRRKTEWGCFV